MEGPMKIRWLCMCVCAPVWTHIWTQFITAIWSNRCTKKQTQYQFSGSTPSASKSLANHHYGPVLRSLFSMGGPDWPQHCFHNNACSKFTRVIRSWQWPGPQSEMPHGTLHAHGSNGSRSGKQAHSASGVWSTFEWLSANPTWLTPLSR